MNIAKWAQEVQMQTTNVYYNDAMEAHLWTVQRPTHPTQTLQLPYRRRPIYIYGSGMCVMSINLSTLITSQTNAQHCLYPSTKYQPTILLQQRYWAPSQLQLAYLTVVQYWCRPGPDLEAGAPTSLLFLLYNENAQNKVWKSTIRPN